MSKRHAAGAETHGLPLAARWLSSATTLDVHIAASRQELIAAFELAYRCYLVQGFIQPSPGGIYYHPSYGLATSRTLVASHPTGQVVGTLTVVGDGQYGLPLETTYPHELMLLRRNGRRVAEISALAIEKPCDSPRIGIFFALTHFMIHYALWRRYDDLVMGVHPRHRRFYERCFRVQPIGPVRPHALVCGSPAVAYRIDMHALHEVIRAEVREAYEAIAIAPSRFTQPGAQPADRRYLSQRTGLVESTIADHHSDQAEAA